MENKKIIPGFGCRNGQAVINNRGREYYSDDPLALARFYNDNGADELFITDLSENDEDHEKNIGIIKEIAREVDIPIITGGRVKRLEDVKKYLYAGTKAVFLDMSDDKNIDLIKEASDRFGKEKIYALIPDLSCLKRAKEFSMLGASVMILKQHKERLCLSSGELKEISECQIPFLLECDDAVETIMMYLNLQNTTGVILTIPDEADGNLMNMKQKLTERGIRVNIFESSVAWDDFKKNDDGLVPVIVQDYKTLQVLMMAYMNEEAFYETLKTGRMNYYSRSRKTQWLKGETSGHFQYVRELRLDCDNDTVLAKVAQVGAACHTGSKSCFFQTLVKKEYDETNPLMVFEDVYNVILDRKIHPKEGSYTNYLFDKGIDKILKKVGEECTEIVIAAKNPDPEEIKYEISDFLYHVMVLMADKGVTWEDITKELANR